MVGKHHEVTHCFEEELRTILRRRRQQRRRLARDRRIAVRDAFVSVQFVVSLLLEPARGRKGHLPAGALRLQRRGGRRKEAAAILQLQMDGRYRLHPFGCHVGLGAQNINSE